MNSWMLTAGGKEYHLCGSGVWTNTFDIHTVAHSLAQINRFTGHASRPYSVAEHSLLCADIAERMQLPPVEQYAALMHDGHESYVGDVSSPAKIAIGQGWNEFEATHARDFRRHFGLTTVFVGARLRLRRIDLIALATERRDLTPWNPEIHEEWPILDTPGQVIPPADWVDLRQSRRMNKSWEEWRDEFVERYTQLRAANALDFQQRFAGDAS